MNDVGTTTRMMKKSPGQEQATMKMRRWMAMISRTMRKKDEARMDCGRGARASPRGPRLKP